MERANWCHFMLPFGFTITQHEQNVSGALGGMTPSNYSLTPNIYWLKSLILQGFHWLLNEFLVFAWVYKFSVTIGHRDIVDAWFEKKKDPHKNIFQYVNFKNLIKAYSELIRTSKIELFAETVNRTFRR